MRSAGLPVFLIGFPINYADCLIGSPIAWHHTACRRALAIDACEKGMPGSRALHQSNQGQMTNCTCSGPPPPKSTCNQTSRGR